jgi:threonylcarbamoyladenosine tRNA methylthiotransferase MtaB
MNASPDIDVVTFGCRLNTIESEAMRRAARDAGHDQIVIVNTCAVTQEAVRQARQTIRRIARDTPHKKIVVTGCAAQIDPQAFADIEQVARIIGNADKTKAESWRALDFANDLAPRARVNDIMALPETAHHFVASGALDSLEGHTRAFVEVQNGCDHRCTFCIIPYGRGPSRSAAAGDVVEQIRRLVGNGYREAVLTGVDITSWGHDLPGAPKFGKLVKSILRHVPDLARLRISSIDCIEADDDLMDCIANESRLMPHLHLSLQSGDDLVLKRMKRRHLRDHAIRFCEDVRKLRPEMVFGADIIAGFPTETEDMFQRSVDLVEDCSLTFLHVFPYSPRPGTPAARMPQVAHAAIRERAKRLRDKGAQSLAAHLDRQRGRTLELLTEAGGTARARDFTPVRIAGFERGQLIAAQITGHDGAALEAIPVREAATV